MDQIKIGTFIKELRKEKGLTQEQLAEILNVSGRTVSRWETGTNIPDISLLASMADTLGVNTSELLNGERGNTFSEDVEKTVDNALSYGENVATRKLVSFRNVVMISFSAVLLMGIIVCFICDVAISGAFTWSRYSISSCMYAWIVFMPVITYGNKGVFGTLTAFSIFTIPFLYVIRLIVGNGMIMRIGIWASLITIAYAWCVYLICRNMKGRKLRVWAFSLLLLILLDIALNVIVSKAVSVQAFDVWDALAIGIILIFALILLGIDYIRERKSQ